MLVGDIATVDRADGWARAVAIAGDRIVAVGTEDEVRERVGGAAPEGTRAWGRPGGGRPTKTAAHLGSPQKL